MLTIAGKSPGKRRPLFDDFSIALPPVLEFGGITLGQMIEYIVREQVAAFQDRQQKRQVLRVLTAREITEGTAKGKIEMGAGEVGPQDVDPDGAVETALQAFEDGLFLVVIDGRQQEKLDQQIEVLPESRITFVRLTMLAGG